jgi:predicted lysophospholipase L1 biosynthesis ABC-type transport system permease subunit
MFFLVLGVVVFMIVGVGIACMQAHKSPTLDGRIDVARRALAIFAIAAAVLAALLVILQPGGVPLAELESMPALRDMLVSHRAADEQVRLAVVGGLAALAVLALLARLLATSARQFVLEHRVDLTTRDRLGERAAAPGAR